MSHFARSHWELYKKRVSFTRKVPSIGEERDPQPQLDASKFANVKIKPISLNWVILQMKMYKRFQILIWYYQCHIKLLYKYLTLTLKKIQMLLNV